MLLAHAHHQAVACDSGVVDQNVDVAEILENLIDNLVRVFEIGGIRSISLAFYALGSDFGFGSLCIVVDGQVGECHVGTLLGELKCDSLADTAGGAGYYGNFSFE